MSDLDKYLGRKYIAGEQDCFSLVREFLADRYNIWIPNVARPDEFWTDVSLDLYGLYKSSDFELISDKRLAVGDVLLMPLGTHVNTHAAVVVEGNQILHHLPNSLSSLAPLRPRWGSRANIILRHPQAHNGRAQKSQHIHEVIDSELFRSPEFQAAIKEVLGPESGEVRSDLGSGGSDRVSEPTPSTVDGL